MRKLTVEKAEILPSKEQLADFQRRNGIKLPDSFIEFLATQNPVYVVESFYVTKGSEPYYVSFFPFSENSEEWTIQKSFNNLSEFFEGKYLSFGSDSGGWQYVMSIQESDYGKIYFCRMDEELTKALKLLANSFDEFVDGLQKDPYE